METVVGPLREIAENGFVAASLAPAEQLCSRSGTARRTAAQARLLRTALLTNSLSPHSLPVCERISRSVCEFRAFVSSDADRYHNFPRAKASFPVTVQSSFNRLGLPRRAYGAWQDSELHVPYDTYLQLKNYKPDLILSVQLGMRTALAVLYRLRRPKVKLILWATLSKHTEERRHWLRRILRRWIVRHVDAVFVNGAQGEEYLRLLGYKGQTYTIPYAIDDKLFRSATYAPTAGRFHLVYAGQLVPQKGIRRFCSVLNQWCADHPTVSVQIDIAGEGPEEKALRGLVSAPNLELSVLHALPQERLAEHYRKADMLAFPTLGDEWGVVVNEAMIAGLPVLGSIYSQAVVELVEQDRSGWLFDPRDSESIYAGLDCALNASVEKLQGMSQRARARIAELSPGIVAERAVRAMEEVSGRSTPS